VAIELRRTVAALMEDFVHVQFTAFDTLVRSGGCDPELVSGLDEGPGERAQRRLAVKASAARLAHKAILWSRHWRWFALHQPETGVVVAILAAARQRYGGWLRVGRAVTARDPVAVANLTGRADIAHPERRHRVALARRAVRALGVGRPETEWARLTWVNGPNQFSRHQFSGNSERDC
jgi:hypothetical protein